MDIKELPKACQLCFQIQGKRSAPTDQPNFSNFGDFIPCRFNDTTCLPKDRAMILLLHRLLRKIDEKS